MTNVAILGTGMVGRALAEKIVSLGHEVVVGTRDPAASRARTGPDERGQEALGTWLDRTEGVRLETFEGAASTGEIVFNATNGEATIEALHLAGADNLAGKTLVDISNALDFSKGFPPTLFIGSNDSLAERIQREFPDAKVVKALNMVSAPVMVNPGAIGDGDHDALIAGNDDDAKAEVTNVLTEWFGWRNVVDLGDLSAARGMEMYLILWLRLMMKQQTPMFDIKIVR